MRDEALIAWKASLFSKYTCLKNQTVMASIRIWFLSPRVATCVIWRYMVANRNQQKSGF